MKHTLPNTSIRARFTQVAIMAIVIIVGIMLSQPAEAQRAGRKSKSSKTIRISSKSNSNKACYLLYKKRTSGSSQKRSTIASARTRKPKYKPMAETDQPMGVASVN
ncbi:MAG: hypothetical protein HOP08_03315 [Cyclobacteriaceae bacterium]|nr:hypothetical protein [Cyclobacteriaceae bacterium]